MNRHPYDCALREMRSREPNLDRAAEWLLSASQAGDPRATYALATWYLHGTHFRRNLRKAVALLRSAAADDNPDAAFDLAVCYELGTGVRKNLRKAAELYVQAALIGEKQSVYEVGRCYYYGFGLPKDRRLARIWLDRAKKLGITDCTGPATLNGHEAHETIDD